MKIAFIICLIIALTHSVFSMESGITFDPYDDGFAADEFSGEKADSASYENLEISTGVTYTQRTGFEDSELHEECYYTFIGMTYYITENLSAGFSVPYVFERFEDDYEIIYENGLSDIQSFARLVLPDQLPVETYITCMILWPTGSYEKYMGTGEFSFGMGLGMYKYFDALYAGGDISYIHNNDPPEAEIPDTKFFGTTAGYHINRYFSLEAGFAICNTQLINREEVFSRNLKLSVIFFPGNLTSVNLNFTYEINPTTAYIPGIMISSFF